MQVECKQKVQSRIKMEEGHFLEGSGAADKLPETSEIPKKKRTRSIEPNPENWAQNKRKKNRDSGLAYVDSRGNLRSERGVRPRDCSKCLKKCNKSFPEEERQKICKAYWGLGDLQKQKLFISNLIDETPVVKTKKVDSRRSFTRSYFLRRGKKKISVCQGFFLATLDVSPSVVTQTLKNRDETTNFPKPDGRGKKAFAHARPEHAKERIRQHIRSFLLQEEAEAGPSIKKKPKKANQDPLSDDMIERVLPAGMNMKRMWDSYVDQCQWSSTPPEKEWLYRDILTKEFNIKFTDPTKKIDKEKKQDLVEEHDQHGPTAGYSNYGYGYP